VSKVELHSAITGPVTEIGRMEISNDGTSRHPACQTLRTRRLGHRRKSQTIWQLLQKAIASVTWDSSTGFASASTFVLSLWR